jgi:Spy/CpxP family protein refolding chaperone
MRTVAIAAVVVLGASAATLAQHIGHRAPPQQPYAGQESRTVTSLSNDEVEGLLAGRGLGMARPAELNGYPGPMHVLELAKELELTPAQAASVQTSIDQMKACAMAAGADYVAAESALDAAFHSGQADLPMIERLVREADARRAEKRLSHLQAHLEIAPLLTEAQRKRYAELRGYVGGPPDAHGQRGEHKH